MNDKQSRPAKTETRPGHRIGLRAYLALLGLAALLIFLLGLVLRLSTRGLRIDPKTTFITEPLTADGTRVDYLAAIEQRIRLDEPWDSEHNRKRHTTNVSCYQCPSAALAEGETTYAVIVGKEAPFDQTGQGRRLSDLGPGYTKRILVVERKLTTCWMDPGAQVALEDARRGINVDPKGIGSNHPIGANVCISSGAATFLCENSNLDEELRPLLGHDK